MKYGKALRLARSFFFLGETMSDIIQAAKTFSNLLDIEYQIILGKKNKSFSLNIIFEDWQFFHLAGLQYLKDLTGVLSESRKRIFRRILNGSLKSQLFESSQYYSTIKNRIEYLVYLEQIMDSNETIFKYNQKLQAFSAIQADFLMKNELKLRNVFTFLSKDSKNGKYFCRSFFPQIEKDYSIGQTNLTLLHKKKINKSSNTEIVLYDRLNSVFSSNLFQ